MIDDFQNVLRSKSFSRFILIISFNIIILSKPCQEMRYIFVTLSFVAVCFQHRQFQLCHCFAEMQQSCNEHSNDAAYNVLLYLKKTIRCTAGCDCKLVSDVLLCY